MASDSDSYLEWWNGTAMSDIGQASPMPGKYVMYDSDAWSSNLRERVLMIECWYVEPTVESTNMGPAVVDQVRRKMRVAIMTEKDIIVDQPSPYKHNRFPSFRTGATGGSATARHMGQSVQSVGRRTRSTSACRRSSTFSASRN